MLIFCLAYLFIGALFMLALNDIFYGAVGRTEFVAGMFLWWLVVLVLVVALFGSTALGVRAGHRVGSRR